MKLFKYMFWRPNDKDCYTRNNLINYQLYFSSVDSFNDPFDLYSYIDIECKEKDLMNKVIEAVSNKEPHLRGNQMKRKAKDLIRIGKLQTESGRKDRVDWFMQRLKNTGVCCFTKNAPDNPLGILMWSHYADQHKGICLEFQFPDNPDDLFLRGDTSHSFLYPTEVTYNPFLPQVHFTKSKPEDWFKILTTKFELWKYENECRTIIRNFVGAQSYPNHLLKSVFTGCRMLPEEFAYLTKTISSMKFQPHIYVMKKKEKEYGLDYEEHFLRS